MLKASIKVWYLSKAFGHFGCVLSILRELLLALASPCLSKQGKPQITRKPFHGLPALTVLSHSRSALLPVIATSSPNRLLWRPWPAPAGACPLTESRDSQHPARGSWNSRPTHARGSAQVSAARREPLRDTGGA